MTASPPGPRRGPRCARCGDAAPPETVAALQGDADLVVCLHEAELTFGVGGFYRDFHQLTDAEVVAVLAARQGQARGGD